jgi:hypothetical protein
MEMGEVELLPLLFSLLIRGFRVGGGILPPCPHHHPDSTSGLPSLFLRPELLVTGMVRLPLCRILG